MEITEMKNRVAEKKIHLMDFSNKTDCILEKKRTANLKTRYQKLSKLKLKGKTGLIN